MSKPSVGSFGGAVLGKFDNPSPVLSRMGCLR